MQVNLEMLDRTFSDPETDPSIALTMLLDARRFDIDNPPPPAVAVFKLREAIIATSGNLVSVQGKAKAGKSALLAALMASTMEPDNDCLGLVSENSNGFALIHIDTEQSPHDHHQLVRRALRRAGKDRPPKWLRSFSLADVPAAQRRAALAVELERAQAACGGILAVILDGVGDLCPVLNDPKEELEFVDELHQMAIQFKTVIVCVLHENPNSDSGKMRGHLGSQLERKAETPLRLEKNGDGVTTIFADRARHCHLPKESGATFAWCDAAKMHVSVASARDTKYEDKKAEAATLAAEVFKDSGLPFMAWADVHRKIETLTKLSPSGARRRFEQMLKLKVITKNSAGDYRLAA